MSAVEALDSVEPNSGPAVSTERLAVGLYERHSKRILGFCIRRLATREEAEDAVQTTFLYAIRALQRGVVPVSETAWLFKIAENVCLATHRSNGRRRARELAELPEIEDRSSESEDGRDAARELVRALSTIPASQQKALLLREWRGLSYREISVQLGVTVASVETLIFRARRGVVRALNGETNVRSRVAGVLNLGALVNAFRSVFGSGATAATLAGAATFATVAALPASDATRTVARQAAPAPAVRSTSVAHPSGTTSAAQAPQRFASHVKAQTQRGPALGAKVPSKPSSTTASAGSAVHGVIPPTLPSLPSLPRLPRVPPPALPPVSIPRLPEIPKLPETPKLPDLPALPDLPVQPPSLPELPKLP